VSQTDANKRTKTPNYNVLFITIIIHEFHGNTKSQTKLQAKHVLLQQKRSSNFSEIKVNTSVPQKRQTAVDVQTAVPTCKLTAARYSS